MVGREVCAALEIRRQRFQGYKKSCEGPLFRRRHLFLISCSVSMVGCEQHKCTVAGLTLRPIQPTHLSAGTSTCSTEHCLSSKSTSNYFWPASLYSKYCFSEVQVCNESKYLLVIDISSAVGISGIRGGKDSFNFFLNFFQKQTQRIQILTVNCVPMCSQVINGAELR